MLAYNYSGGISLYFRQRCVLIKLAPSTIGSYGFVDNLETKYPYFCHTSFIGKVDKAIDAKERFWAMARRFIFSYDPRLDIMLFPAPDSEGNTSEERVRLEEGDHIEYEDNRYEIVAFEANVSAHNLSAIGHREANKKFSDEL